jgi:hypothetical protein
MIWVSSAIVALVAVFASPASAHGGAVDVVVSEDAGLVRAAMVWKKDQEPVTDYLRVSFTAVDVDGRSFGPYPLHVDRAKRGQYVSQRQLPAGFWQVTVTGAGRSRSGVPPRWARGGPTPRGPRRSQWATSRATAAYPAGRSWWRRRWWLSRWRCCVSGGRGEFLRWPLSPPIGTQALY